MINVYLLTDFYKHSFFRDIKIIVGGVIPPQDYDFLYKAGAAAIFGPGSPIPHCAIKTLEVIQESRNKNDKNVAASN